LERGRVWELQLEAQEKNREEEGSKHCAFQRILEGELAAVRVGRARAAARAGRERGRRRARGKQALVERRTRAAKSSAGSERGRGGARGSGGIQRGTKRGRRWRLHRIRMDGDRNWSSPPNGVLVLSSHLDAREDAESWCRNGFYIFCTLYIKSTANSTFLLRWHLI